MSLHIARSIWRQFSALYLHFLVRLLTSQPSLCPVTNAVPSTTRASCRCGTGARPRFSSMRARGGWRRDGLVSKADFASLDKVVTRVMIPMHAALRQRLGRRDTTRRKLRKATRHAQQPSWPRCKIEIENGKGHGAAGLQKSRVLMNSPSFITK